ncbi:sugar phosphate isomerase/epimerase family protein [Aspergillus glaucus CBS 516.65]|uniref:Xylose isomerase-like TIM barrel domain-containing protein n=1 Tax=Aspergillus glaucus CBS 516.65 TaxID=1160497 RepID=A0A1L9VIE6_ASPGL|nr:hypothetical protein ASPGLDRAFT_335292 [Aspergillus glaucus CBS 516.65]OJJ83696.1 hypothetical protein ASPGLDRAFT_335292 [Aspergillus glaucus CBS 516.65]
MMTRFSNKLAISTSSLGLHPSHTLDQKIQAAAQHGFEGIEIVYGDLKIYSDRNNLSVAASAERIRQACENHRLAIIALVPFENYEGSKAPLQDRLTVAGHWINIARILRATYIQVPSQYNRDCLGDETLIVSELQQLADLASAAAPVISIAYEPMSWGIHYPTWESSLRLAELVNRDNFGICLDSFHVATKLWASPFEPSGQYPNGARDLAESLHRSVTQIPMDKLFYLQLSDGERFDPPFSQAHPWYVEGEAPEFTWSKHARPFPLETELGGYLPLGEIVQAWLIDKNYTGWVSLESFDRRMRDEKYRPETAAARGQNSWRKIQALSFESGNKSKI